MAGKTTMVIKNDPSKYVKNGAFEDKPATGMKFDGGKPRFDLLEFGCPDALLGVVMVMTWAIEVKGYKPDSWQDVPDAIRRYSAAIRRHQNAKARGETHDSESGYLHDWHIATNALFIAQLEHNAGNK